MRLQWGRTFSSAERYQEMAKCVNELVGFNGAALFQVRKAPSQSHHPAIDSAASMGPHFFKCGKSLARNQRREERFMLQWGRTFSSAERKPNEEMRANRTAGLQWGRTFSSAESAAAEAAKPTIVAASMGPHFFKCGKGCGCGCLSRRQSELQWGRTFSSAESDPLWIPGGHHE